MTERTRHQGPGGGGRSLMYSPYDSRNRPAQGHLDTGQVYFERIVSKTTKSYTNWTKDYKSKSMTQISHRRRVGVQGAASLKEMAISKVAREMKNIREEDVMGIPERVGRALWAEIIARRLESFHSWRVCAAAFPDTFRSPYNRYFVELKEPSITSYLPSLNSQNLKWLACLRVNPRYISRPDLVALGNLDNLAVLDLSYSLPLGETGTGIDEHIFRSWVDMFETGGSFKHLRALFMRGFPKVSDWIFRYLHAFPALCFLIVTECPLLQQRNRYSWQTSALQYGWDARFAKRGARSVKSLIDDKNIQIGAVSSTFYASRDTYESLATTTDENKLTDRLPLAEFWVGDPVPWLHMIEEYPGAAGARTIWFDNTKTKEWARKIAAEQAEIDKARKSTYPVPANRESKSSSQTQAPTTSRKRPSPSPESAEPSNLAPPPVGPRDPLPSPPRKRTQRSSLRAKGARGGYNLDNILADFSESGAGARRKGK